MDYTVPDDANYNGPTSNHNTSSDFCVLNDNAKITYVIHKAEIRTRNLRGNQIKSLNLGLICTDHATGMKNYIWDELYIDQSVWLEKDKRNQPWMLNMYLAFTNSCGLRPQGSRTLPGEWFSDAGCYDNLSGQATVSKTVAQYGKKAGQYINEIKHYEQQKAPTQQTFNTDPNVSAQVFHGDPKPDGTQEMPWD